MPFQGSLNADYPPAAEENVVNLETDDNLFKDFPDTSFGLRNRSMTFHFPANTLQNLEAGNSFAAPKLFAPRQTL